MLGILFLVLGVVATKVTVWQMGFLSSILGTTTPPDYTIAAFALTAAIIFFGLWLAGAIHKEQSKARVLLD